MEESAEIASLIPYGNNNGVLLWMRIHLDALCGQGLSMPTVTRLVEEAVVVFKRRQWLDDPKHWVWNAAHIALEDRIE